MKADVKFQSPCDGSDTGASVSSDGNDWNPYLHVWSVVCGVVWSVMCVYVVCDVCVCGVWCLTKM
jgi:hypothetical protein